MRSLRTLGLLAMLFPAALLTASPALAWRGPHGRIFIGGGWFWGCPGPYGCGSFYGPPYGAPPPNYALVDTDIAPEEAKVSLDGEEVGTADDFDGFPGYLVVSPGKHVVEFRRPGYQNLRFDLQAHAGRYYDLDRKMKRGGEGTETEQIGEPLPEPPSARGKHEPSARSTTRPRSGADASPAPDEPRGAPQERSAASDENGAAPDPGPRAPQSGEKSGLGDRPSGSDEAGGSRLVLRLRPDDAAVYLDGRLLGAGEGLGGADGTAVAPGRHVLEVVKPGFAPYKTTLVLQDGETRNVAVRLEPAAR